MALWHSAMASVVEVEEGIDPAQKGVGLRAGVEADRGAVKPDGLGQIPLLLGAEGHLEIFQGLLPHFDMVIGEVGWWAH